MWERVVLGLAGALAPLIAFGLRNSRRSRLRHQVSTYIELAEKVQGTDAALAQRLRGIAGRTLDKLEAAEDAALNRRVEGSSIATLFVIVVPPGALAVWSYFWDTGWKWLVLLPAAAWSLIWLLFGTPWVFSGRADAQSSD